MTREDPEQRPTAREAVERFATIREALSKKQLRKAVVPIPEYHSNELIARRIVANYHKSMVDREGVTTTAAGTISPSIKDAVWKLLRGRARKSQAGQSTA